MDYCEFVIDLKKCIEEKMASKKARVDIRKVVKVNDKEKDGLTICEPGQIASATVYLDDLYDLCDEDVEIEEIAQRVIEVHENGKQSVPEQFFSMYDFENAEKYITCKLVNTEINQKYLEDVPHIDVLDLSIIFYCTCIYGDEGQVYTSKINYSLLEKWGINIESLYELAQENTIRIFGVNLEELGDVCRELLKNQHLDNETELLDSLEKENRAKMYILTNKMKNSGAVNMFIGNNLKKAAEYLDDDLTIIPSSIHEVLILPGKSKIDKKEINEMIASVNREVLRKEDILSDHAYYYSRDSGQITM